MTFDDSTREDNVNYNILCVDEHCEELSYSMEGKKSNPRIITSGTSYNQLKKKTLENGVILFTIYNN